MKRINLILPMFATILYVASCSDGNNEILSEIDTNTSEMGIELTDSVKVNATEINNIVEDILSRPKSRQSDYTIETITDDNGKELMYIVNYDNKGGFVVISATKKCYPVLAFNDSGNFKLDGDTPLGLSMWYKDIKGLITHVNNLPPDSVVEYRAMWRKYENQVQPSFVSRSLNSDISAAQSIMRDSIMRWTSANMTTSDIPQDGREQRENMSEIEELVMGSIYPDYMDEMYNMSVILHRNTTTREDVDNFVLSTWDQDDEYQQSFVLGDTLAKAGCGPVAMGQVMRYFEFPSTYNWVSMPLNYGNKTISDFLYDLAMAADASLGVDGTGVTTNGMLNAMTSKGYSLLKRNHVSSIAWSNILQRKPVILTGVYNDIKGDRVGHAWVASGGEYIGGLTQDEVWTFTGRNKFECIHKYNVNPTYTYYLYMNWGWGGYRDGYYIDNPLNVPNSTSVAGNREMLYNITPNR